MPKTASSNASRVDGSEPYILRLPNEILFNILELVIDSECLPDVFWLEPRAHPVAARLLTTCRRFKRIVTPKLYSVLNIVSSVAKKGFAADQTTTLLHRTLEHNSTMRQYCQKLIISLDNKRESDIDPLVELPASTFDFISWLSHTSHLTITGLRTTAQDSQSRNLTTLISTALSCLPRLTTLRIHGMAISVPSVLDGLGDLSECRQNLSALEIYGIGDADNTLQWQSLRESKGTAPIKRLKIERYGQTPELLEALIKWPTVLEGLSFQPMCAWSIGRSGLFDRWSFAVLQPILEVQMANLQELSIPDLDVGDVQNLDLSGFKMLEVLRLPSTLTGYNREDIPRLVSPNLRLFEWKIATWDSETEEQANDFGQAQEDWVYSMVRVAVDRETNLQEIFIWFEPIVLGWIDRNSIYPWDRIANVARHSERYGIKIRHSPPTISSDEFIGICLH